MFFDEFIFTAKVIQNNNIQFVDAYLTLRRDVINEQQETILLPPINVIVQESISNNSLVGLIEEELFPDAIYFIYSTANDNFTRGAIII